MNVEPVGEGFLQRGDIGDMGEDAQLDLGIVEADQPLAGFCHEGLADAAAFLAADGNVLQVRIVGRQPPCVRARDGIACVNAPGVGVDVVLQRVGVGGFELRELPPVEHPRGQVVFGGQVFQNVGGRRIGAGLAALAAGQAHLVEEDLAQLLGRSDVEFLARKLVDFRLEPRHLLRKRVRHAGQRVTVDLDARHLHPGEDRNKRAFQRLVDRGDPGAVELGLEPLPEPQRDVGVLGRVFHGLFDGHAVEGLL